jgi:hypothetical protein
LDFPHLLRFRVVEDAQGRQRLAFSPVLVAGQRDMVRVVLHPLAADSALSGQRIGVETLELPWAVYRVAPVAVFALEEFAPGWGEKEGAG